MRAIAVIARKGGSGKTTVAIHMAIVAHLRGRQALLADSDPQRSLQAGFTRARRVAEDSASLVSERSGPSGAAPQRDDTALSLQPACGRRDR
jgi:cellulose biosynthesis protein BcsQ